VLGADERHRRCSLPQVIRFRRRIPWTLSKSTARRCGLPNQSAKRPSRFGRLVSTWRLSPISEYWRCRCWALPAPLKLADSALSRPVGAPLADCPAPPVSSKAGPYPNRGRCIPKTFISARKRSRRVTFGAPRQPGKRPLIGHESVPMRSEKGGPINLFIPVSDHHPSARRLATCAELP
jgi:hypothetical protein